MVSLIYDGPRNILTQGNHRTRPFSTLLLLSQNRICIIHFPLSICPCTPREPIVIKFGTMVIVNSTLISCFNAIDQLWDCISMFLVAV
jgi:hypothetical protein